MAGTLIVGDMHLKESIVLPLVDLALEETGAGRVVFLGDYCDDWGARPSLALYEVGELVRWVGLRRAEGLAVDCLIGNHDLRYLDGRPGPGTIMQALAETRASLEQLDLKAAVEAEGHLLSHAGVTSSWWDEYVDADATDARVVADVLNELLDDRSAWPVLDSVGVGRGGWGMPGPLWADLSELSRKPLPGIPQIVGHTPVETCTYVAELAIGAIGRTGLPVKPATGLDVWACDTFSTTSYGDPIGDGSVLLVGGTSADAGNACMPVTTRYLDHLLDS